MYMHGRARLVGAILILAAGCAAEIGDVIVPAGQLPDAGAPGADDASGAPEPDAGGPAGADASPTPGADAAPVDDEVDAAPPPPPPTCEGGDAVVEDPASGHCYIYFATPTTWEEGRTLCADLGAHLVTSSGPEENDAFTPLALGIDAWIGGTDQAVEDDWVWLTGEPMDYENWREGEPNDSGGEDCMIVEGENGGLWDDRGCDDLYPVICERE
jgi:hypothetical protein